MRKYDVPHIPDLTKDAARCVESSFRMVLKYFLPNEEYTWRKLDNLLHKPKKKGAWWFSIYPFLLKRGFKIKEFSDPRLYLGLMHEGPKYLYKYYGHKTAANYIKISNISDVMKFLPQVVHKKVFYGKRNASLNAIRHLLNSGYLVIADVNYYGIYNLSGFMSHSVVIVGYDKNNIYINDPAREKGKSVLIKNKTFMRAWHSKGMVALKLKQ